MFIIHNKIPKNFAIKKVFIWLKSIILMKHTKTISEIQEEYELELDKIEKEIKKVNAKNVLLQFPDGMKPWATTIVDYFEEKLPNTQFIIWMESCFGACDTPILSKEVESKIDLAIHFGHSEWGKER